MRLRGPAVLGLVLVLSGGCASGRPSSEPQTPLTAVADQLGSEPVRFTIEAGGESQREGVASSLEHWQVIASTYQIRRLGWIHGRMTVGDELTVTYQHDFPFTYVHTAAISRT